MEPGLEIAGRYRLARLLGGGAFGEVWKAADLLRDRPVAMKFLHRGISAGNPVVVSKFRQEAKIAARLQHPGITRVDDFGTHDGQWFLVMEFLHGRTLAAELTEHPKGLPMDRVLTLGVQLADALVTAHKMGVVHRDLKPANLMVTADDRLKVCDFGIARMADASTMHTFTGRVGTPIYMAPEQWAGDPVDHRTDLYALGGILFTLLTGHPPFTSERLEGLMGQHLNAPPPHVRDERPDAPAALEELIVDLLAKKPDQRPEHTTDVLAHLRRIRRALIRPASSASALPDSGTPAQRPSPPSGPSALPRTEGARKPALIRRTNYSKLRLRFTLNRHQLTVFSVAFSPDGSILATASYDKTVKLWNAGPGTLITTLTGHKGPAFSVTFSPDGNTLATAGFDKTVKLWNARTGSLITTLTEHKDLVRSVAFSPNGEFLAAADGNTVRVWDIKNDILINALTGHKDPIRSVAFSPDGTSLATAGDDKTVRIWNTRTRKLTGTLAGHKDSVRSVAFSPDGAVLATGSYDKTVKLWNAKNGNIITTLTGHNGPVSSVAFSPNGVALATASYDKSAKIWNSRSGKLITTLTGHKGPVFSVAFSPDGAVLATASDDKTARLWHQRD